MYFFVCPDYATSDERQCLLREISLMKDLGYHPNILSMIACCTQTPRTALIMDYCANGDLRNYLQQLREKVRNYYCVDRIPLAASMLISLFFLFLNRGEKGKFEAYAMQRVAAGAHLPTHWLFEPAKLPDDRADYCLNCSFLS